MLLFFLVAALLAVALVVLVIHAASRSDSQRHTRLDIRVASDRGDRRDAA